jgi:hypothetical protein
MKAPISNTLRIHTWKVLMSQQGTNSANKLFTIAREEPSYAEMAFHMEINMTMAAATHDTNGDP